ncbi:MAG: SpoIID/LytB domain-containing protein [Actinobacteria bacterium]|nr:SpoIID/LytB domain-containing protein [Actinomycetota bacterium]
MFKRFSQALSVALLLSAFPISAQANEIPANFSFTGSGYGHGVGMSQIGARAKALAGESATAILNYYYSGTSVETATDTQILRINIGHLLTSAKIRSDSAGAVFALYAGAVSETGTSTAILNYPSKTTLNLNLSGGQISISTLRGSKTTQIASGSVFTLRWSGTRYMEGAPAVLSVTTNNVVNRYRHGQIQFKVVKDKLLGKRIEIVNSVRLQDEYLWGVSEVPSLWPTAALQAQAIASRTYALAKAVRIRAACDCHLYGSISDQTFAGFAKEGEPKFGVLWKNAVDSTIGQIITFAGSPITAYFSSSSGGITETSEHAWGTATPYTLSVLDTASVDVALNPRFASWSRQIPQSVIAAAFVLDDVVSLQVISMNPAGTVALIQATSSTGITAELRGETFRSRSKLPSAWFSIVG